LTPHHDKGLNLTKILKIDNMGSRDGLGEGKLRKRHYGVYNPFATETTVTYSGIDSDGFF